MTDAARRIPAATTATVRSGPRRAMSERRSGFATNLDAATAERTSRWVRRAAARLRTLKVDALEVRVLGGRRSRPRTRCTPTDAFSNMVSWRLDGLRARWATWGRGLGRPSGSRYRAGVSSSRPPPVSQRAYDIAGTVPHSVTIAP